MKFGRIKAEFVRFVKFNLVGVLNTLVDLAVFSLLSALGLVYLGAKALSYGCGLVNSYLWNSRWTFRAEHTRGAGEMVKFVLVNIVALGVSLGVMYLAKNGLRVQSDILANCISIPVSLAVNFAGNRLFVFKRSADDSGEPRGK